MMKFLMSCLNHRCWCVFVLVFVTDVSGFRFWPSCPSRLAFITALVPAVIVLTVCIAITGTKHTWTQLWSLWCVTQGFSSSVKFVCFPDKSRDVYTSAGNAQNFSITQTPFYSVKSPSDLSVNITSGTVSLSEQRSAVTCHCVSSSLTRLHNFIWLSLVKHKIPERNVVSQMFLSHSSSEDVMEFRVSLRCLS